MQRETKYIIEVLSDFIAGRKSNAPDEIDWDAIAAVSRTQQIEGIVYSQCKSFLPPEQTRRLEKGFQAAVISYYERQSVAQLLTEFFNAEQIPYYYVKGLVIAAYYPVPELRVMGDLDIVVHREDFLKIHGYLMKHGFQLDSNLEDREWQYYKNSLEYELHDRLIYSEMVNRPEFQPFFNCAWDYVQDGKLDVSFHFVYLLAHLYKHLLNSGVGFRSFLDVALMAKSEPDLNWDWIKEALDALGLAGFASVCFAFIERWFRIGLPVRTEQISQDFFEQATEQIFKNGAFGFDNEENRQNKVYHSIAGSHFKTGKMLSNCFKQMFPPYRIMKTLKYCSYLNGRPCLLPFAWAHRHWKFILEGKNHTDTLKDQFITAEKLKDRNEYFRNWGV